MLAARSRAARLLKPALSFKYFSTSSINKSDSSWKKSDKPVRAAPDPIHESASEIWTRNQLGKKPTVPLPEETTEANLFHHPLYTPNAEPNTGVGPLIAPLKWPEYDQSIPPAQRFSHLSSPPHWHAVEFEDRADAPIGDYPRYIPLQWAQLKDPFKYWDQQGRREYGELLYDHDNYTDWLGIGPEVHWKRPLMATLQVFGAIGLVAGAIAWWNPENHLWFAEKDYPFNGLRLELGGDPDDDQDAWMAANTYKI